MAEIVPCQHASTTSVSELEVPLTDIVGEKSVQPHVYSACDDNRQSCGVKGGWPDAVGQNGCVLGLVPQVRHAEKARTCVYLFRGGKSINYIDS